MFLSGKTWFSANVNLVKFHFRYASKHSVAVLTERFVLNELTSSTLSKPLKWLSAFILLFSFLFAGSAAVANANPLQSDVTTEYSIGGSIKQGPANPVEGAIVNVEGADFKGSGVSDAKGKWEVKVPSKGEYVVTLDMASLPDGAKLKDGFKNVRTVEISKVNSVVALFPLEEVLKPGDEVKPQAPETNVVLGRILAGLNFGILLAMAAIGLSLIYGTTGLSNFAHGEMVTMGALSLFTFNKLMGLDLIISAILATLIVTVFGYTQDALLWKPLRKRRLGITQMMIVSIGLSILLRYFLQLVYGGDTKVLSQGDTWNVFGVLMPAINVITAGIAVIALLGFAWFLTRTRIGKATRAVSDNASLAASTGIDVESIIRVVWVVASALTGLSGVFIGLYFQASWDTGFSILLLLFAAVTLGGLGTAFGAAVGALIVGMFVELSTLFIPPDLKFAGALVVLILVLLFRPQGVLGRKQRIG
jgi:branched-chain amino acid transport system permease protein